LQTYSFADISATGCLTPQDKLLGRERLSFKPMMKNFSKRGNAAERNASYSTLYHDGRPSIGLLGSRYKSERYRIPFKEGPAVWTIGEGHSR
jgi:hypothetical protein